MLKEIRKRLSNIQPKDNWWDQQCWEMKKGAKKYLSNFSKGKITVKIYHKKNMEYEKLRNKRKEENMSKVKRQLQSITSEAKAWKCIRQERRYYNRRDDTINTKEMKNIFCNFFIRNKRSTRKSSSNKN